MIYISDIIYVTADLHKIKSIHVQNFDTVFDKIQTKTWIKEETHKFLKELKKFFISHAKKLIMTCALIKYDKIK